MILKEYKCIDMTESHEIPTRAEQIQPRPQCLGWIAGRKEWEEGDRRLRYSSIRLRSDLIYANSGGGSVASADQLVVFWQSSSPLHFALRLFLNTDWKIWTELLFVAREGCDCSTSHATFQRSWVIDLIHFYNHERDMWDIRMCYDFCLIYFTFSYVQHHHT